MKGFRLLLCGLVLFIAATAWSAGQDFKGTINGNTITAGTGTVTITAGKTITATQNATLDDTVTLSKKANLETANAFTNIAPMTTLAESWIGPSSTTGIYFKGNNIGIGMTTPGYGLDVQTSTTNLTARFKATLAGSNTVVGIDSLSNQNTNLVLYNNAVDKWYIRNNGLDATNRNRLSIFNAGGTIEVLSILQNGNVGIGTATVPSILTVAGLINMKNYTVGTLPAGTRGDICYVTDALAPTFLAVIVGGGAVVTPVFFNGTAWVGF